MGSGIRQERNVSRRAFLRTAAALGAVPLVSRAGERQTRPNVLFIAIDDLNDWVGCLGGHPDARTPNIDRLASQGVNFTRAYCSAPACNPSRASLLTGKRPSTSGVYRNDQPWRPAMPDAVTLPQDFMANGYRVLGCGKIFHGRFPESTSWHEYFESPGSPAPPNLPLNGIENAGHFDWGPLDCHDADMSDWKLVDWAEKKLAQAWREPFFLAVGITKPHLPWYVPRKYFDLFPPDRITLPEVNPDDLDDVPEAGRKMAKPDGDHRNVIRTDNWRRAVSAYLAAGAFTDACVGRLLDALNTTRYADNTIIVLWGDHGWHLGEKLHWRKFALWEEATRNPLVMVVPGLTKSDSVCGRTVTLMDIYPTLAELCGLAPREGIEARSLTPLLRDPNAPWDRPALTTHGRNNHSLRTERWRYIRYEDGSDELYDHDSDPLEWVNLAGREEYVAVKQNLARWFPTVNAPDVPSRREAE